MAAKQNVTVLGPNLPRKQADQGTLHVHATGCADIARRYRKQDQGEAWTLDAETVQDIIFDIYPPEQFDYDPETEYDSYRNDVHVAPCVTIPETKEEVPVTRQETKTRRTKKETAKAEATIAKATEAAVKRQRKAKEWPCTAEEITAERDGAGRSWAQVAVNLGLGSPGQARKAYTALTGRPHHESQMTGRRAPRGMGARTVARKVDSPQWNDDTDQDEIEAKLNGPWVEESGDGKNYVPGHWSGSTILVERQRKGSEPFYEEVTVKYVQEFSFGKNGDQPLHVFVIDKYTGGNRCFAVADIVEVR